MCLKVPDDKNILVVCKLSANIDFQIKILYRLLNRKQIKVYAFAWRFSLEMARLWNSFTKSGNLLQTVLPLHLELLKKINFY